jgi:hypothetical protein
VVFAEQHHATIDALTAILWVQFIAQEAYTVFEESALIQ